MNMAVYLVCLIIVRIDSTEVNSKESVLTSA